MLKEYALQEEMDQITNETIDIPTHFARQVAIPYNLMKIFLTHLKLLLKIAFDQFIGRPPQTWWAADISNANLATITNMFQIKTLINLKIKKTHKKL